jgi:hypothetical protein
MEHPGLLHSIPLRPYNILLVFEGFTSRACFCRGAMERSAISPGALLGKELAITDWVLHPDAIIVSSLRSPSTIFAPLAHHRIPLRTALPSS